MANVLQDIPSSVFWSFTDKPVRSSVVIPEDLAIPLEKPGKLKINIKTDSVANSPSSESPLKINTLGQSYSIDSPDSENDFNINEFIRLEGK